MTRTRLILYCLAAFAAAFALVWLYSALTARPRAEARLSRSQAEAASQSGSEAVNVVGRAGDREAAIDETTRTNEHDIRQAEGADAAVAAPARDAGLFALCRRDSYKRDPKCLSLANPR